MIVGFSCSRWEVTAGTLWWNTSFTIVPSDRQQRDFFFASLLLALGFFMLAPEKNGSLKWISCKGLISIIYSSASRSQHMNATVLALCLKPPARILCLNLLLKWCAVGEKQCRVRRHWSGSLCRRWPKHISWLTVVLLTLQVPAHYLHHFAHDCLK